MGTRKYHQTNWAWVMHATKTLSSNAPHLGDKFQTKHVHYADMQNVSIIIVHHGMCGVICATQPQHTQHGKMQPMNAVAPKDYDKQKTVNNWRFLFSWWMRLDSNQRPLRCERSALTN